MSSKIAVSVIVPVYNVEQYLDKCLISLINQTLDNIEIICVNDGSTDGSLKILEKYANLDKRVVIINKQNSGVGLAREDGLRLAQGEYIGFVDADDWVSRNYYEKLYQHAISSDADIAATSSVEMYFENEDTCLKQVGIKNNNAVLSTVDEKAPLFVNTGVIWNKIYKKSFLKENNIKQSGFNFGFEDNYFTILSVILANRIATTNEAVYYYRQIGTSLTKVVKDKKQFQITDLYKIIDDFLFMSNVADKEKWQMYINQRKVADISRLYNEMLPKYKKDLEKHVKAAFPDLKLVKQGKKSFWKCLKRRIFSFKDERRYKILQILGVKIKFKKKLRDLILHIDKKKLSKEIKQFTNWGLSQEIRNPKVIVSLTSFPQRMYDIHFTLYSLLTQSFKPDAVVLWLSEEEFPNKEKEIPDAVLKLQNNGLSIKWCENMRSYSKLIHSLTEFEDDIIVTADDDIFYPVDWLKTLYDSYLTDKDSIHCHRAYKMKQTDLGKFEPYGKWKNCNASAPFYSNFLTGVGGVLYPPHSLYKDAVNKDLFKSLAPYADDIWFWAMAVVNARKIKVVQGNITDLIYINPERELRLNGEFTLLSMNGGENMNDSQLKNVLDHYPSIMEKINNEQIENFGNCSGL